MPKYFENPTAPNDRVMADGEGRFFFTDLPAGDYYLQCHEGRLCAWDVRPAPGVGPEPALVSRRGRAAHGRHAPSVEVRCHRRHGRGRSRRTGRRRRGAGAHQGRRRRTPAIRQHAGRLRAGADRDDRRSRHVPAVAVDARDVRGRSCPPTQTTVPAAFVGAPDSALRSELFFAGVAEVSLLGQPRTQQVGDFALLTLNRVLIPPPPSPAGRMAVYPDDVLSWRADGWRGDADCARSRRGANRHHDRVAAGAGGARVRPPRARRTDRLRRRPPSGCRRRDDRRHHHRSGQRAGPRRLRDRHGHERCDRPVHAARRAGRRVRPHARQPVPLAGDSTGPARVLDFPARHRRHR